MTPQKKKPEHDMIRRSQSAADRISNRISTWRRFAADASGTTAMEYGVMAALISLAIIGAVTAMGSSISTVLFGNIASQLSTMAK
jgi:pilus assembly protein Flp/PilA